MFVEDLEPITPTPAVACVLDLVIYITPVYLQCS